MDVGVQVHWSEQAPERIIDNVGIWHSPKPWATKHIGLVTSFPIGAARAGHGKPDNLGGTSKERKSEIDRNKKEESF